MVGTGIGDKSSYNNASDLRCLGFICICFRDLECLWTSMGIVKEWVWSKLHWCLLKELLWVDHNLPAGIPAKAIIEVPDTFSNKSIILTSIAWIKWTLSKEANKNNQFN